MTALMMLGIGLVLLLVGQIPVGGRIEYQEKGLFLWLRVGLLSIQVLPRKIRKDTPSKQKQSTHTAKSPKQPPAATATERLGGALPYAKQLIPLALEAAKKFSGKIRVDTLHLELIVATADPADTAMLYGRANAILGAMWYPLTQAFRVKDGRGRIRLDFEATQMTLYATAAFSIGLGQVLWLGIHVGSKMLRSVLSIRKEQKMQQRKAV